MESSFQNTRLDISLSAIRHNYRFVARSVSPAVCAPVIKANAYGLGLLSIADALMREGARTFFVGTLYEGLKLRKKFESLEIYVLEGVFEDSAAYFLGKSLIPILSTLQQVKLWNALGKVAKKKLPCALKIETGLFRLGLSEEESRRLSCSQEDTEYLELKLIMSHLASPYQGGDFNGHQKSRFDAICACWPNIPRSLSATGGLYLGPSYHYDLVRVGGALYGGTSNFAPSDVKKEIKPVVTLSGRIICIQDVPAQASIGYGRTFMTRRLSRIATVGTGFANGYPRALSNKGVAYFGSHALPVVGMVSMNMMMVDVTEAPSIRCGDWIELMGARMGLNEIEAMTPTNTGETLTRLGGNTNKVYTDIEEADTLHRANVLALPS